MKKGRLDDAIMIFERLINEDFEIKFVYYNIAMCYEDERRQLYLQEGAEIYHDPVCIYYLSEDLDNKLSELRI